MKRTIRLPIRSLTLVLVFTFFSNANAVPEDPAAAYGKLDEGAIDRKVDPCQNFYQFACGSWLKKAEIPADRSAWSRSFYTIADRNEKILKGILDKFTAGQTDNSDPDTKKLGMFYQVCMDEKKAETGSLATLKSEFARIDRIKNIKELGSEVGKLHSVGGHAFFSFGSTQDLKDSSLMIGGADQGGITLPDRDYYLSDASKMPEIRKLYKKYLVNLLKLLGTKEKLALKQTEAIIKLETSLAASSLSRVDRRDPARTYHRLERAGLESKAPLFNWSDYFKEIGVPTVQLVNVGVPEFFVEFNKLLTSTPLEDIKTYLRWSLLNRAVPTLGKKFVDEQFHFVSKALSGEKELRPRWKRCISAAESAMGESLGRSFVKTTFGADGKIESQAIIANVEETMKSNLKALKWMDDKTKTEAIKKLGRVVNQVGYPGKWRDFTGLEVTTESYLRNRLLANRFNEKFDLDKIGKPVDRDEWMMYPQTVNAYYSPENNQMVFPAGILQTPFFNKQASLAVNYGGIGMVMGHELTHGFDDQGRQFDDKGNFRNWWSGKVADEFKSRAECLVKQYDGYTAIDDLHVNGKLTLGENIADQGGIKLAFTSYQEAAAKQKEGKALGFTAAQQFFVAFAQSWCTKQRPEHQRMMITVDPHSPAEFRVNGPLVNFAPFAESFSCKVGTKMAPKDRCEVW